MKRTSLVPLLCLPPVAVVILASSTIAAAEESAVSIRTMLALKQQNRSGQSGTATLVERADGTFTVKIRMSKPVRFPGASQNAHIHNVTCAKYARMKSFNAQLATVVDWLTNLSQGRSTTHVSVPLAKRTTGRFAINVHEQNAPYTVVACGDIPRAT
jgi:hypothetical protein